MFYALYDKLTGRTMCTGCNSTSIPELAKEYLSYVSADYDEVEDADMIEILKGDDVERIKAVINANSFDILESNEEIEDSD